jgi:ribosomal protein S18 acetylase RimI-like enzyme
MTTPLRKVTTGEDILKVRELLLEDEFGNLAPLHVLDENPEGLEIYVDEPSRPRMMILFQGYWHFGYVPDIEAASEYIKSFKPGEETDWAGVEEKLALLIREGRKVRWDTPCYLYYLPKEKFERDQSHEVSPLREGDAPLVHKYWPYGDSESEWYVRERIQNGPSVAIYEDGEPVAWALTHSDGSMGMFHVLEEYRRKGYGRSVNSALTELLISQGKTPFCYIADDNIASISLVERAGLVRRGHYYYFGVE